MEKRMDYELWCEQFKPVTNHIDDNAGYDGCLFETYGPEYAFIAELAESQPNRVWTLLDSDGEDLDIVAGWHFVNRLGYFVTEVGFDAASSDLVVEG